MSDDSGSMALWHEAAALASVAIYEADDCSNRWAGGFSTDGDHIEVIAIVDGHEVSVDSSRAEGTALHGFRGRLAIGNLLATHVLESDVEPELPYSVTVEQDDRAVTVDGEVHTATGMRIAGHSRWVGTLQLGDASVTITTDSPARLSLRRCADMSSLPEFPPGAQ